MKRRSFLGMLAALASIPAIGSRAKSQSQSRYGRMEMLDPWTLRLPDWRMVDRPTHYARLYDHVKAMGGFMVPVVINDKGYVIDGTLRVHVARALSMEIPAVRVNDITYDEMLFFQDNMRRDNRRKMDALARNQRMAIRS